MCPQILGRSMRKCFCRFGSPARPNKDCGLSLNQVLFEVHILEHHFISFPVFFWVIYTYSTNLCFIRLYQVPPFWGWIRIPPERQFVKGGYPNSCDGCWWPFLFASSILYVSLFRPHSRGLCSILIMFSVFWNHLEVLIIFSPENLHVLEWFGCFSVKQHHFFWVFNPSNFYAGRWLLAQLWRDRAPSWAATKGAAEEKDCKRLGRSWHQIHSWEFIN